MSIARQFNIASTAGDPKLKLPLVAVVSPATPARKETALKSAITQIAEKQASKAKPASKRRKR